VTVAVKKRKFTTDITRSQPAFLRRLGESSRNKICKRNSISRRNSE